MQAILEQEDWPSPHTHDARALVCHLGSTCFVVHKRPLPIQDSCRRSQIGQGEIPRPYVVILLQKRLTPGLLQIDTAHDFRDSGQYGIADQVQLVGDVQFKSMLAVDLLGKSIAHRRSYWQIALG
jgi:hypothetical protein